MQILLAQLQDNNNDIGVKCSPMKSREDSTYLLEASMHSDSRLFINFGSQHEEVEVVNDQFCAEDLEADVKADLEMQENDPKKLAIILIIAVVNVGSLVMCCSVPSIINHDDRVQNVPEKKEWVPVFLRSHFMPVVRNGARVELTLTPAHAESEKNEVVRVTPKFMSKYNPLAMDLQDGSLFEPGLINATSTLAHEDDETFSMTDPENNDYVYTDNVNEVLNVNPQMATGNYLVTLWFMYCNLLFFPLQNKKNNVRSDV